MMPTPWKTALLLACLTLTACGGDGGAGGGDTQNNAANNASDNNGAANNASDNNGGGAANNGAANNGGLQQPQGGPNELVSLEEILDPETLELELDVPGSGVVESQGAVAWLVNFTFTSHTWEGGRWRHQASLYLPLEPSGSGLLGVVQREQVMGFGESFGISTASTLGLPILILNDTPPVTDLTGAGFSGKLDGVSPRCQGGPLGQVDVLTNCLLEVVRQSGDSSLDPFLHMSIPFMRAITAVQHLGPEISQQRLDQEEPPPPTISVSSAALMADAWRGPALPIAAAIDPRVVGTFQAAPFGALPAYFALQQESWASGHSLGDPRDWLSFLESPDGQTYQQRLDPAAWPPELLQGKKMMFSWGTQTTFAPPQSLELYRAALPQDTWSFSVADYEDGITSGLHLPMWQVFLRACDGQRALPQVSATASDNQGNVDVSARVELPEGNQISGVSMIYVQRHREDDDMDFRDAIWQSSELEPKDNGTWNGTFAPLSQHTAVVVQVQDFGGEPGTDAISASTMQTLVLE